MSCHAATRETRKALRRFSACHKSYCVCWFIQLSELVPNAIDSRTAISGLMPARPLSRAESVLRLMPSAAAASVTESSSGSRQSLRMISPGWGGYASSWATSVIIHVINIHGIFALKPESNTPVGTYSYRPGTAASHS